MVFVGIDFGTTNSAVAIAEPSGEVRLVPVAGSPYWRTVLYFEPSGAMTAGGPAIARYLETEGEGRLVQSIKSHLASAAFSRTHIFGRRWQLEDMVAAYLRQLRAAAPLDLGSRCVIGRPVRYWGAEDAEDDARAVARMREALAKAGFDEVVFEHEPVGAAARYAARLSRDELIVVADFGGGTTDFTLIQVGPRRTSPRHRRHRRLWRRLRRARDRRARRPRPRPRHPLPRRARRRGPRARLALWPPPPLALPLLPQGLFPSDQITPRATPDLAKAARVTLERRIGRRDWEDVEWSRGNLIAFFARLHDGDEAHKHVLGLLREDTDADLLTFSRAGIAGAPENIFCVDGNSAGPAAIAEMLLQSHSGEIELLPALPKAWSAGSVRGLKARGNVTVDIEWKEGRVSAFQLGSPSPQPVTVRVDGATRLLTPEKE